MKNQYLKKGLMVALFAQGVCLAAGETVSKRLGQKALGVASSAKTALKATGAAAKKAAISAKSAAESSYSSAKKAFGKLKKTKAAEAEGIEMKEVTQFKGSAPLEEWGTTALPKTSLKTRLKESAGGIKESIVAAPGKLKTGLEDAASSARQKFDDMLFARRAKKEGMSETQLAQSDILQAQKRFANAQAEAVRAKKEWETAFDVARKTGGKEEMLVAEKTEGQMLSGAEKRLAEAEQDLAKARARAEKYEMQVEQRGSVPVEVAPETTGAYSPSKEVLESIW